MGDGEIEEREAEAPLQVGECVVRPASSAIIGPQGETRVEGRSMLVLHHLARHAGEVVSRRELIAAVWGDAFVSDEVLSHCIWDLRRALGDDARQPTYIRTVPRRGYRLIAPVQVLGKKTDSAAASENQALENAYSEPAPAPVRHRPSTPLLWGAIALVIVTGVLAWWLIRTQQPKSLQVLVLTPEIVEPAGADPPAQTSLELAASNAESTLLAGLAAWRGLTPLDASMVEGSGAETPLEAARAVAADEILVTAVEGPGELCWLSLRRLDGATGETLWAERAEARCRPDEALLFADGVRALLGRAYPGRTTGGHSSVVAAEDYRAFLDVHHRLAKGESPSETDLRVLETVIASSPSFLEAHLRAADLARSLWQYSRQGEDLSRARRAIDAAEALAPDDPRPRERRLRLALLSDDLVSARKALDELIRIDPAGTAALDAEIRWLEHGGQLEEALDSYRRLLELRPSWRVLYRLASLELRLGQIDASRRHLEELLEITPRNRWGRSRLAELELFHGDLERTVELYQQLAAEKPRRNYLTNLGIAHFLRGDPDAAAESYRRALAMAPDHPTVLFNLAEAELARGRTEPAAELFRQVLERLEQQREEGGLGPVDRMNRALCLAWLGRHREAVGEAHETLRDSGESTEALYLSAQVHALAGDLTTALVQAKAAREQGMSPRWFRAPGFEALEQDAGFRTLLEP